MQRKQCWCMIQFLSTLSLRRATAAPKRKLHLQSNFYPRSPCGERPSDGAHPFLPGNFYPRSPCGERPDGRTDPRGGRFISIHALLAESDLDAAQAMLVHDPISIHALLAESDPLSFASCFTALLFLSTLSLRRATPFSRYGPMTRRYFYPRSPCGERPYGRINDISRLIFLSTLSLRRATSSFCSAGPQRGHFYPRSPCGERPRSKTPLRQFPSKFLSTLSLRRATGT